MSTGHVHQIKILNLRDINMEFDSIDKSKNICSIAMSKDGHHLLVNSDRQSPCIDLYELINPPRHVKSFTGHKQRNFMIECAFAGVDECFIISGSEDDKLMVWD